MAATKFYMEALSNYGDGDGRASRSEFWYFQLVYIVLVLCGSVMYVVFDAAGASIVGIVLLIGISVFHIIPSWTVAVRRLHDTGRSGWWLLMPLLPAVAMIVLGAVGSQSASFVWFLLALVMVPIMLGAMVTLIVFLAQKGTDGNNDYGRTPRTLQQI